MKKIIIIILIVLIIFSVCAWFYAKLHGTYGEKSLCLYKGQLVVVMDKRGADGAQFTLSNLVGKEIGYGSHYSMPYANENLEIVSSYVKGNLELKDLKYCIGKYW